MNKHQKVDLLLVAVAAVLILLWLPVLYNVVTMATGGGPEVLQEKAVAPEELSECHSAAIDTFLRTPVGNRAQMIQLMYMLKGTCDGKFRPNAAPAPEVIDIRPAAGTPDASARWLEVGPQTPWRRVSYNWRNR